MRDLNLTIELVPSDAWYHNLRKIVAPSQWKKIRADALARADGRCEICDAEAKSLDCHERWRYDEESHVLTLEGFMALCKSCHLVKYIGLAGVLASQGQLDMRNIVRHFMVVNDCSREQFETHSAQTRRVWKERSQQKWKVDFGKYKELLPSDKLAEEWVI